MILFLFPASFHLIHKPSELPADCLRFCFAFQQRGTERVILHHARPSTLGFVVLKEFFLCVFFFLI